jgi:hypothetical protein
MSRLSSCIFGSATAVRNEMQISAIAAANAPIQIASSISDFHIYFTL